MKVPPNQTDAPNPGMTPQFHARREWPGVGDPCRWVSRLNTTAIMIHRICALIMVVVPLLFLCAGCGTVAGAQRARGTGTRRTYEAPPDKVWNAIPAALTQLGLSVASNNRADGCILATGGVSGWSWGEKIAVFVYEISPSRTQVEVVSKRALATNVTARNWEDPVLNKIEDVLRAADR